MHELAIAEAIADVVREHASGRRVETVRVRVGHLRQVVPSALEFAFELVVRETPLEGAALEIEAVPVAAACRRCGAESPQAAFPFRCRSCGSDDVEILRGEELLVESLDVADVAAPGTDARGTRHAFPDDPRRTTP